MPTHESDRLADAVARRGADEDVAVLCVDVEHVAWVDDTLGRAMGDALLVEVAARLRTTVAPDDVVVRLGDDGFVVIAVVDAVAGAYRLAEAMCGAFTAPFDVDGTAVAATAGIGLATGAQAGTEVGLLQAADLALDEAKAVGGRCWVNYLPGITPRPELPGTGEWVLELAGV